jgi:hypothetical protein
LGSSVTMQIAHFRALAHIVVAHQPVEVERRSCAGIGFHGYRLRASLCDDAGGVDQDALGRLEARAFGQIDTTCTSDLLSNGSSFTRTVLEMANSEQATSVATPTMIRKRRAPLRVR